MQITRKELEAQGIFIPTKVDDELLARFRVGSLICLDLEAINPLFDKFRLPPLYFKFLMKIM